MQNRASLGILDFRALASLSYMHAQFRYPKIDTSCLPLLLYRRFQTGFLNLENVAGRGFLTLYNIMSTSYHSIPRSLSFYQQIVLPAAQTQSRSRKQVRIFIVMYLAQDVTQSTWHNSSHVSQSHRARSNIPKTFQICATWISITN